MEILKMKDLKKIVSKIFWKTGAIKVSTDKPFQMTSGKLSPYYVDCRLLISFPFHRDIMTIYAHWLCEEAQMDVDWIAGGETAGMPFAAWLAGRMNKPYAYIRKSPKGHGLGSQIEGNVKSGDRILLYEDMITDGLSKINFMNGIRNADCVVKHCLVLLDRQEGGQRLLQKEDVSLHTLVTMDDCLNVGLENEYLNSQQADIINEYRKESKI